MPRFFKGMPRSSGSFPQNGILYARNTFQASNWLGIEIWELGIRWVWWDELQDSNCLKLWCTDDCLWSGFVLKWVPNQDELCFQKDSQGLSENFHDYRKEGQDLTEMVIQNHLYHFQNRFQFWLSYSLFPIVSNSSIAISLFPIEIAFLNGIPIFQW